MVYKALLITGITTFVDFSDEFVRLAGFLIEITFVTILDFKKETGHSGGPAFTDCVEHFFVVSRSLLDFEGSVPGVDHAIMDTEFKPFANIEGAFFTHIERCGQKSKTRATSIFFIVFSFLAALVRQTLFQMRIKQKNPAERLSFNAINQPKNYKL